MDAVRLQGSCMALSAGMQSHAADAMMIEQGLFRSYACEDRQKNGQRPFPDLYPLSTQLRWEAACNQANLVPER